MPNVIGSPHDIPPDAQVNPAYVPGVHPHTQYPFAELGVRDIARNSGGPEGANPDTPAQNAGIV